jgi:hypothetical protein
MSMNDSEARALSTAARAVERCLGAAFYETIRDGAAGDASPEAFADPIGNAAMIKRIARRLGAVRTGICTVDPSRLLSRSGDSLRSVPSELNRAIVMLVEMDADEVGYSPAAAASAETSLGYMRMALCASGLARFIAELGFRALPAGNGLALSVPLAADAGLGRVGRHGMLIAPDLGPCVRICKVFTDMPLQCDDPAQPRREPFCATCDRCARACEGDAIAELGVEGGEDKGIDASRCTDFWKRNNGSCANCIAACPFTGSADR